MRAQTSDNLQSFCFYLLEIPTLGIPAFPIKTGEAIFDKSLISFQSIELPSMAMKHLKYQEGNWPFEHSIITGHTSTGQVKIRQAVSSLNIDFYQWFLQAVSGDRAFGCVPRRHFTVILTRADRAIPAKEIILWDCIPTQITTGSELNASNSEILIEELTMECNRFDIIPGFGTR